MKKVYFFAVALFATTSIFSQNDTLTFESYDLGTNDYYNGADGAGNIVIGNYTLSNNYNTTYGYMESGFAISKVQDITTAGYTNQYASYANGGANGSTKYAVSFSGEITFSTPRKVKSLMATNTTYAALSMKDGDTYAKQFGSPNDANGNPDGTNGNDWFKLQIIPLDETDNLVGDTVEFYLADFRFSNDADDYIVNTWKKIEMNDIVAKKLTFKLSSSDVGTYGMNTPAYFALDNLVTAPNDASVQSNTISSVSIYPNPANSILTIVTNEPTSIDLINAVGQVVKSTSSNGKTTLTVSELPTGVYYVSMSNNSGKSIQKVVIK
ncbi:MAG: DUF4465 domain-containing protein [Crocinitomicaceae bacterium]|nr:DUF4465 domain-containing protein [Crocinitomicaceae bacterium]